MLSFSISRRLISIKRICSTQSLSGSNVSNKKASRFRQFSSGVERLYTPRRAVLYVPASDNRKLAKIPTFSPPPDCVCIDCEDGVAINKKGVARSNVVNLFQNQELSQKVSSELSVRINSVCTGSIFDADMKAIFNDTAYIPRTIHLPKVDSAEDLRSFTDALSSYSHGRHEVFGLIIFIESALSLLNLRSICAEAKNLSLKYGKFVLEAIVFGSDDFVANIGASRSSDDALIYARQKLVVVAKAFGLQVIDMVYIKLGDSEGLRKSSQDSSNLGFTGRQIIHPDQVKIVQEAYAPTEEEIDWATQLIKEFQEHQKDGKGAFNFRGIMIDMPLVKQAQNIIDTMTKMQ